MHFLNFWPEDKTYFKVNLRTMSCEEKRHWISNLIPVLYECDLKDLLKKLGLKKISHLPEAKNLPRPIMRTSNKVLRGHISNDTSFRAGNNSWLLDSVQLKLAHVLTVIGQDVWTKLISKTIKIHH